MKLSVPVRCDAVVCSDGYEYEAECSTVSLDIQNMPSLCDLHHDRSNSSAEVYSDDPKGPLHGADVSCLPWHATFGVCDHPAFACASTCWV